MEWFQVEPTSWIRTWRFRRFSALPLLSATHSVCTTVVFQLENTNWRSRNRLCIFATHVNLIRLFELHIELGCEIVESLLKTFFFRASIGSRLTWPRFIRQLMNSGENSFYFQQFILYAVIRAYTTSSVSRAAKQIVLSIGDNKAFKIRVQICPCGVAENFERVYSEKWGSDWSL